MSRVGNKPINLEEGVEVNISKGFLNVIYGSSNVELSVPDNVEVVKENGVLKCLFRGSPQEKKSNLGSFRQNLSNTIIGLKKGFSKKLLFVGTGYKAELLGSQNEIVRFYLGYSHAIYYQLPESVKAEYDKATNSLLLKGNSKQVIGDVCAAIKSLRRVEPYKGKGVRLEGQFILRKEIKSKK